MIRGDERLGCGDAFCPINVCAFFWGARWPASARPALMPCTATGSLARIRKTAPARATLYEVSPKASGEFDTSGTETGRSPQAGVKEFSRNALRVSISSPPWERPPSHLTNEPPCCDCSLAAFQSTLAPKYTSFVVSLPQAV